MKNGYYITSKGEKVDIIPLLETRFNGRGITELVIPDGMEQVYCHENKLTKLILADGVERVICHNNKLTELIIPEGVRTLECDGNRFKEHLLLPKSIKRLWCDLGGIDLIKYKHSHIIMTLFA